MGWPSDERSSRAHGSPALGYVVGGLLRVNIGLYWATCVVTDDEGVVRHLDAPDRQHIICVAVARSIGDDPDKSGRGVRDVNRIWISGARGVLLCHV